MSARNDPVKTGGSWPIIDGALPAELFPDEHLRIALFEYLPLAYQCAAVTIRQGIKAYSDWPTIPQLYVKGEFVGGSDIMMEMFEAGELQQMMDEKQVSKAAS